MLRVRSSLGIAETDRELYNQLSACLYSCVNSPGEYYDCAEKCRARFTPARSTPEPSDSSAPYTPPEGPTYTYHYQQSAPNQYYTPPPQQQYAQPGAPGQQFQPGMLPPQQASMFPTSISPTMIAVGVGVLALVLVMAARKSS